MVRPCYGDVRQAAGRGITQWFVKFARVPTRVSSSDIEIPSTVTRPSFSASSAATSLGAPADGVDRPRRPDPGRAVRRLAAGQYPVQLPWQRITANPSAGTGVLFCREAGTVWS